MVSDSENSNIEVRVPKSWTESDPHFPVHTDILL